MAYNNSLVKTNNNRLWGLGHDSSYEENMDEEHMKDREQSCEWTTNDLLLLRLSSGL